MTEISVIICTHDPRPEYLNRVFRALDTQTVPKGRWELLVIDNASGPELSRTCSLSWHPDARLVREEALGLTRARLRGITEARGQLLLFVDDDNVLAPDYLEVAQELISRHPHLGAIGAGRIAPEFEREPPAEIRPYLKMLALRAVSQVSWSNNLNDNDSIPWGAGLCVTRIVAMRSIRFVERLKVTEILDRRGDDLFSHGDDIFSRVAVSHGLGFGVFPELQITHLIGARRLTRSYILRLVHDEALSQHVLHYVLTGDPPRPIDWKKRARLLVRGMLAGRFSMQCLWAAFRGEERAVQFISRHQLRPLDAHPDRHGLTRANPPDPSHRALN
jgi:hypothetical protein